MFRQKAQSTLEYVLIITAIIAAVIVAAASFVRPRVSGSIDTVTNKMQQGINRLNLGS